MAEPEIEKSKIKSEKKSLIDSIIDMDQRTATRIIVKGFLIAVIFGTVLLTSRSVMNNADTWMAMKYQENRMNYWEGEYGLQEFRERQEDIDYQYQWMRYQYVILGTIARLGVNLAMVLVVIGFLGLASNKEQDSKYRLMALVFGGLILLIMMFTTFFTNFSLSMN